MLVKLMRYLLMITLAWLLAGSSAVSAQLETQTPDMPAAPLGTAFTYQGRLEEEGAPAEGDYDFRFKLFDAPIAGNQVGSQVDRADVPLNQGYFTLELDFGDVWDGRALWLEVAVRSAGSRDFTLLSPRQALGAVPYAVYSLHTPWSGLSGTPRNDHNHLGQTWVANGGGLIFTGSFGGSSAPLVLNNFNGAGLLVNLVGTDGVQVKSALDNGVEVTATGGDGVNVYEAKDDGIEVYKAGNPTTVYSSTGKNGFEVAGAEHDGLYVGYADWAGVAVFEAGTYGFGVDFAQTGVSVGFAVTGVEVNNSNIGIDSKGNNYAGYFEGDVWVSGVCIGCAMAVFGVNASQEALQQGDVVTVLGVEKVDADNGGMVWRVAPAVAGQALLGVVQGKAEVVEMKTRREGESGRRMVAKGGAAAPGEYLAILIGGVTQVRAGGTLAPGARLTLDERGLARPLRTTKVNGVQVSEYAPTLGIALAEPDEEGWVWALINPH